MKKTLKKIITIIILVSMIFVLEKGVQANDQTQDNLELNITGKDTVELGEEITLTVNIEGVPNGVMGMQGTLKYDNNVLELKSKEVMKDGWMISMHNEQNGKFLLELTDDAFENKDYYIYKNTPIIELKFKVKEEVNVANSVVEIADAIIVNENYETENIINNSGKTITINGASVSTTSILGQDNNSETGMQVKTNSGKTVIIISAITIVVLVLIILIIKKKKR